MKQEAARAAAKVRRGGESGSQAEVPCRDVASQGRANTCALIPVHAPHSANRSHTLLTQPKLTRVLRQVELHPKVPGAAGNSQLLPQHVSQRAALVRAELQGTGEGCRRERRLHVTAAALQRHAAKPELPHCARCTM